MTSVDERAFRKIADVDSRYWASLFFGLIFAYVGILVVRALGYASAPRLFPLIVGVPLLLLIVGQIALLVFGDRLGIESVDLFESAYELDTSGDQTEQEAAVEQNRRELEMIVWSLLSFVLIWAIGHIAALVVFVFGFIYAYERSLKRAAIATVITFTFIYLLFVTILDASLWPGVFGGMIL